MSFMLQSHRRSCVVSALPPILPVQHRFRCGIVSVPAFPTRFLGDEEVLSDEFLDSLADRTVGFSGRQLSKFVFGLQAAVFGSGLSVV